jgi:ribosome-binding factor A
MSRRIERLNSLIRRDLSDLIRNEVKDPRVAGEISVTRVDTSADVQHAKVYVSVYGTLREKEDAIAGLDDASGFIRRQLRGRLETRNVPVLRFVLDESLDEGNEMLRLLDSLNEQMPSQSDATQPQ